MLNKYIRKGLEQNVLVLFLCKTPYANSGIGCF